jgi:hypothetical protein
MRLEMLIILVVLMAFWVLGLLSQLHTGEAVMRYLALSLALVAIGVWRWQPRRALRRRLRDRRRPPD